jgi:hypothetical protein
LYCRVNEVVSRKVDTGTVMLKLSTASYYGLDESGTVLWNALMRPCGTQELAALLQSEFQIDEAAAICDVNSFVHDLLAEGLIESTAGELSTTGAARVISIAARNAGAYLAPVLERGLLRNAANSQMGAEPDGGHTPGGTTQYS